MGRPRKGDEIRVKFDRVPTNIWSRRKCGQARFHVDIAKLTASLIAAGFPITAVESMLGVKPTTIQRWKKNNPEFALALDKGKEAAIRYLKGAAIQLACGYDYQEIEYTVVTDPETGKERIAKKKVHVKHRPPNTAMLIFLLVNFTRNSDEPLKNIRQVESPSEPLEFQGGENEKTRLLEALQQELKRSKPVSAEVVDEPVETG